MIRDRTTVAELDRPTSGADDSVPTVAAIGLVAYVWADLLHEFIGHGTTCAVTGGRIASFSAFHLECRGGSQGLVTASGMVVNAALGFIAMAWLRRARRAEPSWRYFLTLTAAYNLFGACGYVLSSASTGSGDFANLARLSGMTGAFEIGLIVLAAVVYAGAILHVGRRLDDLIGADRRRRWVLIFVPYFTAASAGLAAATVYALASHGAAWMSALGTTLGSWGFLFLPLAVRHRPDGTHQDAEPIASDARWWAWAIGSVTALLIVARGYRIS